MLQVRTEEMMNKMDEMMDSYKAMIDLDTVMEMDSKTFEVLQKSFSLYEHSKSVAVEQAKIIESLDRKTDELLQINKILLQKLEESKGV